MKRKMKRKVSHRISFCCPRSSISLQENNAKNMVRNSSSTAAKTQICRLCVREHQKHQIVDVKEEIKCSGSQNEVDAHIAREPEGKVCRLCERVGEKREEINN